MKRTMVNASFATHMLDPTFWFTFAMSATMVLSKDDALFAALLEYQMRITVENVPFKRKM